MNFMGLFKCSTLSGGLEVGDNAERPCGGAGVDVAVDTGEHLGIETLVLGDDEGVLDGREDAELEVVVQEVVEGVTQVDVVTAQE